MDTLFDLIFNKLSKALQLPSSSTPTSTLPLELANERTKPEEKAKIKHPHKLEYH